MNTCLKKCVLCKSRRDDVSVINFSQVIPKKYLPGELSRS